MDMDITFTGKHVRMLQHISISREGWIIKASTSLVNLLRSSKIHLCPFCVPPISHAPWNPRLSLSLCLSHTRRERKREWIFSLPGRGNFLCVLGLFALQVKWSVFGEPYVLNLSMFSLHFRRYFTSTWNPRSSTFARFWCSLLYGFRS